MVHSVSFSILVIFTESYLFYLIIILVDFGNEQCSLRSLGEIDGIIGKIKINEHVYVFLIINSTKVANLDKDKEIKRIDKVISICITNGERIDSIDGRSNHLDKLKNSQKKLIKLVSRKTDYIQPKIVDELLKLLNDNGDFYFETNYGDITKNTQRYVCSCF